MMQLMAVSVLTSSLHTAQNLMAHFLQRIDLGNWYNFVPRNTEQKFVLLIQEFHWILQREINLKSLKIPTSLSGKILAKMF